MSITGYFYFFSFAIGILIGTNIASLFFIYFDEDNCEEDDEDNCEEDDEEEPSDNTDD